MQPEPIDTESSPACYLCGQPGDVLHSRLTDRLFGAPGEWTLKQCRSPNCGLVWLDPRPTAADIGKAYQTYYTHDHGGHRQLTRAARIVRGILHPLSVILLGLRRERRRYKRIYLDKTLPGRLLEVGCGNGKRLARMQKSGWQVAGQEVDPLAADQVRQKYGIAVHLGPLETMDTAGPYDAIIMSHVIEHVHDPLAMLQTCHRLLKKDGVIVLLTPNTASYGHRTFGADWRGLEPPRHLHLFNQQTLTQLAEKAGFGSVQAWTTPVGAYGIGQSSRSAAELTDTAQLDTGRITVRDVLRGFRFQVAASVRYLFDKNSGEECVLIAKKIS